MDSSGKVLKLFIFIDLILAILETIAAVAIYCIPLIASFDNDILEKAREEVDKSAPIDVGFDLDASVVNAIGVTIAMLAWVLEIYLFMLGRRGIKTKNYQLCRKWFILRWILLCLACPYLMAYFLLRGDLSSTLLLLLFGLVYQVSKLVVAKAFFDSLKQEEVQTGAVAESAECV